MNCKRFLGTATAALMIVIVILILVPSTLAASKYKTLYKFRGGKGGIAPLGLVFDQAGNLYGTTEFGGAHGRGTVFQLTPNGDKGWTKMVLYSFLPTDGSGTAAGVIFDHVGNLYGTMVYGGAFSCDHAGCGAVFRLIRNADGSWTESVIHSFNGQDGQSPHASLILDQAGNLYGTTKWGGTYGLGTVFELSPNGDGTWTERVLHSFKGGPDGAFPYFAGLIFDPAGNLYGTTWYGGDNDDGAVFKLSPNGDGTWTESILHSFNEADGRQPLSDLIFDQAGNLYGTTPYGGAHYYGTVFKLAPNGDGTWTESVLYSFCPLCGGDGETPMAGVVLDAKGNLYGTTFVGGSAYYGMVFKLKPIVNGDWKKTVLHSFWNRPGAHPQAGLIFDAAGNLYGTTTGDGVTTYGSVFEITP